MDMDSRTVAFLAVAAFMSFLLLCCIVLSVLFYVRYKNTEVSRDDKDRHERERIKKLKDKLMKQFKNDLKKETSKRQKSGKVAPAITDDVETACSICLDSLADGVTTDTVLALLVKCGHIYHMDCVWPWLERDHSCPICRREMTLTLVDLKAVSIYHVFNHFDVPSIRESVSRADLHSRLACECLEVTSVNGDDLKTPRSSRIIPVRAVDGLADMENTPGYSAAGMATEPSIGNGSLAPNLSLLSSTLNLGSQTTNPSLVVHGAGASPSSPNVTFTIGGDARESSNV